MANYVREAYAVPIPGVVRDSEWHWFVSPKGRRLYQVVSLEHLAVAMEGADPAAWTLLLTAADALAQQDEWLVAAQVIRTARDMVGTPREIDMVIHVQCSPEGVARAVEIAQQPGPVSDVQLLALPLFVPAVWAAVSDREGRGGQRLSGAVRAKLTEVVKDEMWAARRWRVEQFDEQVAAVEAWVPLIAQARWLTAGRLEKLLRAAVEFGAAPTLTVPAVCGHPHADDFAVLSIVAQHRRPPVGPWGLQWPTHERGQEVLDVLATHGGPRWAGLAEPLRQANAAEPTSGSPSWLWTLPAGGISAPLLAPLTDAQVATLAALLPQWRSGLHRAIAEVTAAA